MKKTKEYKISIALFVVALILDGISLVTGLIPGFIYPIDDLCRSFGNVFLILGFLLLLKAKENSVDK